MASDPEEARPPPPTQLDASQANKSVDSLQLLDEKEIERLARVRPEAFKSKWAEIGFVTSICMAQIMVEYFVSGFNVLVPTVIEALDIDPRAATWPASAFSLVLACFLLPMGRYADMYGGKLVFVIGMGWLVIWSIVVGVAQNEIMLDVARALAGLGPAAFLPSSVMLLGSVYRPGPRKNKVFSVYGACAPVGFFFGIFIAGLSAQLLTWRWYFFIGAIISAISFGLAWVTMPSDKEERAQMGVKMDYTGSLFIIAGLILVVFAFTDSGHAPQGWRTPRIPITFSIGMVMLGLAVWWEGWKAEQPLLPAEIFKVFMFPQVISAMLWQYGGLGIFLLYSTFFMDGILGGTPLQLVAWFAPLAVGGTLIAVCGGFVLHIFNGTTLMLIAGTSWVIAPLLFALMPPNAMYWAWVFPAMVCGTVGIDISFNISNIFITTGLPKRQQGLAGAIINSMMHLSIALFLGLADIIAAEMSKAGKPRLSQLRAAFWFEVAVAGVALLIIVLFVRLDRAKADLTADEKERMRELEQMQREAVEVEVEKK